jgi:hypothetical protein
MRLKSPFNHRGTEVAGTIAAHAVDLDLRSELDAMCGGCSIDDPAQGGAERRQHQRFLGEFDERDRVVAGQVMASVHQQQQVFGEQRLDGDLGVVDRQVDDRSVDLLGDEARNQVGGVALVGSDMHARVLPAELQEELGEQPAGGGAQHTQARVASHFVAPGGHLCGDVVEFVQHPAGLLDHDDAVVGEAATLTVDEDHAELFLQPTDVPADVGLHGVQRSSRRRERTVVGDRDQGGELAEVHLEK